jgi:hypothetical protein
MTTNDDHEMSRAKAVALLLLYTVAYPFGFFVLFAMSHGGRHPF